MIIIRLKGGMGNQMFQYAFGLRLAQQLNTDLKLDLSSLLDRSKGDFVYRNYDLSIFKIDPSFVHAPTFLKFIYQFKSTWVTRQIRKAVLRKGQFHKETDFHFQQEFLISAKNNSIYEGWFQSPEYFAGIESTIRDQFSFREDIIPESRELRNQIKRTNSICLNVRRTDFLKVDTLNTTDKNYFFKAADHLADMLPNPVFFVFSDDLDWCKENLLLPYPVQFVDHEHKGNKFGNYLQLMIACKHFIIPNSSFAWWAVWLNQESEKMVVAPKLWFNDPAVDTSDLIPKDWIRI